MKTILAHFCGCNPSAVYCFIDQIELFFKRRPKGVGQIRALQEGLVWLEECRDCNGFVWGYRLIVHQPKLVTIMELDRMQKKYKALICRLDVAADFVFSSAEACAAFALWFERNALLRWRPFGRMFDEGNTRCWVSYKQRKQEGKKCRRDITLYDDEACRLTGEPDCAHVELRLISATVVRATGYERVRDLIKLNPHRLLKKHIKLVDFDREAFLQKRARAVVDADRRRYRGKTTTPFVDRYRASISRRAIGFIERFKLDRAQRAKDLFGVEARSVDFDLLCVPDHLEWHQSHDNINTSPMSIKYPCDFNQREQEVTMQHQ